MSKRVAKGTPIVSKNQLIEQVAKSKHIDPTIAKLVVDGLFAAMCDQIYQGNAVNIIGFGRFHTATAAARNGIDPRDQTPIKINARQHIKFRPSKYFNYAVNIKPERAKLVNDYIKEHKIYKLSPEFVQAFSKEERKIIKAAIKSKF